MLERISYEMFKNRLLERMTEENFCPVITKNEDYERRENVVLLSKRGKQFCFDVKNLFDTYMATESLDDIFKQIQMVVENYEEDLQKRNGAEKKDIIMHLINYEKNRNLLKTRPHRRFLDLAIVYSGYYSFDRIPQIPFLYSITNENVSYSESELFELAQENTNRLFPSALYFHEEIVVITSTSQSFGAIYMLFNKILDTILIEKEWKGIYLCPMSVDEVVAVSSEQKDVRAVRDQMASLMYKRTRKECISEEVYYYRKGMEGLDILRDK